MKNIIKIYRDLIGIVLLSLFSSLASAGVGEVVFVVGEAKLAGQAKLIKKGDQLEVGDILSTGVSGHVHVRFVDHAFVSVRPNSQLKIERYTFNPDFSKDNAIRFSLDKGTARLITGKAGEANKEGFRLNTPVAAIGIRGTDFAVQTDASTTRVSVVQGGVVVSPFNDVCKPSDLGGCSGQAAKDLEGSLSARYLEVASQRTPQLIQSPSGKSPFALPRPEEPGVKTKAAFEDGTQNAPTGLVWGRWTPGSVAPPGQELLGQNDAFVLYRNHVDPAKIFSDENVSQNRFVSFDLVSAEAYARPAFGEMKQAEARNAALAINFNTRQYTTSFNWVYQDQDLKMISSGRLSDTGRFQANHEKSNFAISGGLSGNGDEAGYLFMKRLPADDAYGILLWRK